MTLEFVDTNVLLYAYDITAGDRHTRARDLIGRLGRNRTGALSVQILQEFYVNAVRKIAVPLRPDSARERLRIFSRWVVHSPLPLDVVAAAEIAEQNSLSFWDAMVLRSATKLDCPVLWSEDLNPGQRIAGVEIRNPFSS